MNIKEINDIFLAVSKFNLQEMEIQDQAQFLMSVSQFAEQMKPIVIKYADKLPEECTFLLKI